jgi:pimeloyl-ACP methyl ester carboxylesterase
MRLIRRIVLGLVVLVGLLIATGLLYDPDPAPLRLSRETVVVDGTRLSYHRVGAGRDVVLVHGGMGSAEDFEPILEPLARDHRVTAIDRPGFGLSRARGDDATYPGNARLVAGLVRTLGVTRPVVVGHSHGGGVALILAERHPDLVGGLVLLAAAAYPWHGPDGLARVASLPLLGEGLSAWLAPVLGDRMIAAVLNPMIRTDGAFVPADFVAYRQTLWTNPRSLATRARQQTSDLAGQTEIAAGLGRITAPSVVVGCSQDPTEGTLVDSRRLARELPGSELRWLDGCGHFIQFARSQVVVDAIRTVSDRVR